jgi:hypothetical protein
MNNIRPLKKHWKKEDCFKPSALMAVKKLGRELCAVKMMCGWSRPDAARWAVHEVYYRLPGFVSAWEKYNSEPWRGTDWFSGRVDHQSSRQDNKASHMRIQNFVEAVAAGARRVYTWDEWEKLVENGVSETNQTYYLYLLPLSHVPGGQSFDVQKVGITTNLDARLKEHHSRCERGTLFDGLGLWPADRYALTHCLGATTRAGAELVENECKVAIADGRPALYGQEYYATNVPTALGAVRRVLKKYGFTSPGDGWVNPTYETPMIIQIRGTSGSGKSTAVRKVLDALGGPTDVVWRPAARPGRKVPLYYRVGGLAVLGHYETPCGGCDTVGSARAVYELIRSLPPDVTHVLCEGLLLSEDVKWTSQLENVRVIFLDTPPAKCLEYVRRRRAEAGNDKPLDPANTLNRVAAIERARARLSETGVFTAVVSPGLVPGIVTRWLGARILA